MRHQDIKTSRHQDIKTSESRRIYYLFLMFIIPSMVIYSCTEVENIPDDVTVKNDIELRSGEEVETTIFDVGSCGDFYSLQEINDYCKQEEGRFTFSYTGIEPFPNCEFIGEATYIECKFKNNDYYDVYINEPKFTTNCPEFAEFISANDLRWGDAIEIALQGIMSRIEYDLWFNELEYVQNMDVCHNSPHHEISWIKATCTSTRALIDLNNNITIVKEYCQGSGCCSRNTYYCYSEESGEIEKIVSNVEVDQPANECENSEVVNEEYSGTPYGTSIPCSHNCDEIED